MRTALIKDFIGEIKKLPGVRLRQAEKMACSILSNEKHRVQMERVLEQAREIEQCLTCGWFKRSDTVCDNCDGDHTVICVTATVSDVFSIERSGEFSGSYHILGGLVSPLDNIMPDDLMLDELGDRVLSGAITEVILALPATIEGEATVSEILERISGKTEKITRIARGIPTRSGIGNMSGGTITLALKDRREIPQ